MKNNAFLIICLLAVFLFSGPYLMAQNTSYSANNVSIGGSFSVGIGSGALGDNTGTYNTALGYRSLFKTTSGSYNVGLGSTTLLENLTGANNVAI